MEEEEVIACRIINKIEPVDLESEINDVKTTLLKNMSVIESDNEHILIDSVELVGNSDGNLEINTIQQLDEAMVEQIG